MTLQEKMNNSIVDRLRVAIKEIRRKPYPISDIIPLLIAAADALEKAENNAKSK